MKRPLPSVFKTKEFKRLFEKMPKVEIIPLDKYNKEDKKKAMIIQKIINYQFSHNKEFRLRYFDYINRKTKEFVKNEFFEIQMSLNNFDDFNKSLKK